MTQHFSSPAEKRVHLENLLMSMQSLRQVLAGVPNMAADDHALAITVEHTQRLLAGGFTQYDLNEFEAALPDPLGRRSNPRWEPPLEKAADGTWNEADWYLVFAAELDVFVEVAAQLRIIGHY